MTVAAVSGATAANLVTVDGITYDQTIADTFSSLSIQGGKAANASGDGSGYDSALAYLNSLTPAQLAETSNQATGAHKNITWGQLRDTLTVYAGLEHRQAALIKSGVNPNVDVSKNNKSTTAGQRELEYINELFGAIGHDVPGAFSKAKSYLASLNNPTDVITLSDAALKALHSANTAWETANPFGVASSPIGGG